MGWLARKRRGYAAAFKIERFRPEAEALRESDPDFYKEILAHAEGPQPDPDAYVALWLHHLTENMAAESPGLVSSNEDQASRGQLNAVLYDADPEHEQYTERSFELVGELLETPHNAGSALLPDRVVDWSDMAFRSIKGWQDAPIQDLLTKGALLAGCEDWSDVDTGHLQALIGDAYSAAGMDKPRDQLTVMGVLSWDPDQQQDEGRRLPGYEALAQHVQGWGGVRRLASIQEEHAELTRLRVSHQDGLDVPEEHLLEFRRSQRRAWYLGVTLGVWEALGLLPAAPQR